MFELKKLLKAAMACSFMLVAGQDIFAGKKAAVKVMTAKAAASLKKVEGGDAIDWDAIFAQCCDDAGGLQAADGSGEIQFKFFEEPEFSFSTFKKTALFLRLEIEARRKILMAKAGSGNSHAEAVLSALGLNVDRPLVLVELQNIIDGDIGEASPMMQPVLRLAFLTKATTWRGLQGDFSGYRLGDADGDDPAVDAEGQPAAFAAAAGRAFEHASRDVNVARIQVDFAQTSLDKPPAGASDSTEGDQGDGPEGSGSPRVSETDGDVAPPPAPAPGINDGQDDAASPLPPTDPESSPESPPPPSDPDDSSGQAPVADDDQDGRESSPSSSCERSSTRGSLPSSPVTPGSGDGDFPPALEPVTDSEGAGGDDTDYDLPALEDADGNRVSGAASPTTRSGQGDFPDVGGRLPSHTPTSRRAESAGSALGSVGDEAGQGSGVAGSPRPSALVPGAEDGAGGPPLDAPTTPGAPGSIPRSPSTQSGQSVDGDSDGSDKEGR